MPGLQKLACLVREEFASRFGSRPDLVAAAPGRINVIGEHTDYVDHMRSGALGTSP